MPSVPAPSAPPRVPATAFPRPRLLARLDGVWDLAVLHGPSGSGKSVLLAQWATTVEAAPAWIDGQEIVAAFPPGLDRARALADWLRSLDATTIVIDDAEVLGPVLAESLGAALDRVPSARLVLAVRSREVAEAVARGSDGALCLLDQRDLEVTAAELASGAGLSAARVEAVLEESGGLMLAVRAELDGSPERMRSRFLSGLLERAEAMPPAYRAGLPKLVVLRHVNEQIARLIGWEPGWLLRAEEDGLGRYRDGWLSVGPFAAAALAPLAEGFDATSRQRLAREALDSGFEADQPAEALRLAVQLGDLDRATEVIGRYTQALVGDARALREAFAGVPVSRLSTHPILMLMLAQAANLDPSTRVRALRLFSQATLAVQTNARQLPLHQVIGFRLFLFTLMRITPLADQALRRTAAEMAVYDTLSPEDRQPFEPFEGAMLTHAGLSALSGGDLPLAADWLGRAISVLREAGRAEAVDPMALLAATHAIAGDLTRAREQAELAEGLPWPDGWRGGLQGQGQELALAILALESGDADAAQAHLESIGPVRDILEHWYQFAIVQGWRDALQGDWLAGRRRIRETRQHRSRTPVTSFARARIDATESLLALLGGDVAGAKRLARAASAAAPEGWVALARTELVANRDADALSALRQLSRFADLTPRVETEAETIRAVLVLRAGDELAGDVVVGRLADLAGETGLRIPFLGFTDADRDLLVRSARRIGQGDFAEHLLRARPVGGAAFAVIPVLTDRERAVLEALLVSRSTTAVADRLYVSPNTVKSQLRSLYRKLGVSTREQAIARAAVLDLTDRAGLEPDGAD